MDEQKDINMPAEAPSSNELPDGAESPPAAPIEMPEADSVETPETPQPDMLSQESIDNVLGGMGEAEMSADADEATKMPEVMKADFQQLSVAHDEKQMQNIDLLMDVDLPVSIELGRTRMSISDILALGPGSVVELDKLVGEPVDLLVNQKCVARGEVVVVEESFGLRITQLMSAEERIKNLR
jgi:flagellar motor switch protein FliN/FliY